MSFTMSASLGDEQHAVTISAGGSPTGDIDVIIDDTAFTSANTAAGQKATAILLLRRMADKLEETGVDWPPA